MPGCTTCSTGWARTRPAETTTCRRIAGCFPAGERVTNPRSWWRSSISRFFDDLTAGVWIHTHGGENAIAGQQVIGGFKVTGAGQVDLDDRLDGRGPAAHDHHAVRQLNGFLDVVGHEEDRLPLFLPDPHQVGPHLEPGEEIQ